MRRPTRTWWTKRHDIVTLTILGVVVLFILWATFVRASDTGRLSQNPLSA